MDYKHGKTFNLPTAYTALNGQVQYYTVVVTGSDFTADQNAYLKFIETIKLQAQPIITAVTAASGNSTVKFTLEQANVWGKSGDMQVKGADGARDLLAEAKTALEAVLKNAGFTATATIESVIR